MGKGNQGKGSAKLKKVTRLEYLGSKDRRQQSLKSLLKESGGHRNENVRKLVCWKTIGNVGVSKGDHSQNQAEHTIVGRWKMKHPLR